MKNVYNIVYRSVGTVGELKGVRVNSARVEQMQFPHSDPELRPEPPLALFQFHVIASYPRVWNMPQSWQCEIEVYKATYHFIYAQKNFFTGKFPSTHDE